MSRRHVIRDRCPFPDVANRGVERPRFFAVRSAGAVAIAAGLSSADALAWGYGPTGDPCHPPGQSTCGDPTDGDPINIDNGNISEEVIDYTIPGPNKLVLARYYNTRSLWPGWRITYDS